MSYKPTLKQNSRFESLKTDSNAFKQQKSRRPKNKDASRRNFIDRLKKSTAAPVFNYAETMFPEMETTRTHTTNTRPIMDFTHIKDIKDKKPAREKVPCLAEGWIRYVKLNGSWYDEEYVYDKPIETCKPYRLTGVAERFEKRRQDLNELLGDLSPYWNETYDCGLDSDSDSDS